jgi:rare lipoprotein A
LGVKRLASLAVFPMLFSALVAFAAEEGLASWYAGKFQGRKTASGETFDTAEMTAAHKTLPFGTRVKVTNLENGRDVIVRINDRGPFVEGRIIDLSRAAADALAMTGTGVARVRVEVVPPRSAGATADKPGEAGDTTRPASFAADKPAAADPAQPGRPRYSVQVAAFSVGENAARAVERLNAAGLRAAAEIGSDGLHRVRVKGVDAVDLASVKEAAARAGFAKALAVPE